LSIRGVVSKISSTNHNGKTLWSIRLNGDNNYYNTGERVPPVQEGASIEFETKLSPSGRHGVLIETIRPWEGGSTMQAVPANTFPKYSAGSPNEKDTYWKDKEIRDKRNDALRELGATRNTAIAFVNLLIEADALKLPAADAKKEQVIWDAFVHYTDKLMGKDTSPEVAKPAETTEEKW